MGFADPAVTGVRAAAYTVPTDRHSADGTLAWDATTIVVVHAAGGGHEGVGWTYGPPACARIVRDQLAPVVCERAVLDVPAALEAMVRAVRNAGRPGAVGMPSRPWRRRCGTSRRGYSDCRCTGCLGRCTVTCRSTAAAG